MGWDTGSTARRLLIALERGKQHCSDYRTGLHKSAYYKYLNRYHMNSQALMYPTAEALEGVRWREHFQLLPDVRSIILRVVGKAAAVSLVLGYKCT